VDEPGSQGIDGEDIVVVPTSEAENAVVATVWDQHDDVLEGSSCRRSIAGVNIGRVDTPIGSRFVETIAS